MSVAGALPSRHGRRRHRRGCRPGRARRHLRAARRRSPGGTGSRTRSRGCRGRTTGRSSGRGHCDVLAQDPVERGMPSSREGVGQVVLRAQAVVVTSGGIGANAELVRQFGPERLGTAPRDMVTGVPAYVDGSMLEPVLAAGARLVNRDRMWHYTEGLANHSPVWPGHGIRILPGPADQPLAGRDRATAARAIPPGVRHPWDPGPPADVRAGARTTAGSWRRARCWARSTRCPAPSRTPT